MDFLNYKNSLNKSHGRYKCIQDKRDTWATKLSNFCNNFLVD